MTHPRIPTGTATHIEPEVVTLPQAPRHTPGPWHAGRARSGRLGVWATPLQYSVLDETAPGIDAEANARLIAAAPELLAALTALAQHAGPFAQAGTLLAHAYAQACAAIARATGE